MHCPSEDINFHAGEFFEQISATAEGAHICQWLISIRLRSARAQTKMVDEIGIFSTVILERLSIAEEELKNKEIDNERVKHALDDIRSVLMPITKRHFSKRREGFKHVVGTYYPMLQRQAIFWLKQFRRRMSTRCSVKDPWHICLEDRLPKELFGVLEEITSKTNYGLITVKTKKNCVFAFTSRIRVRRIFLCSDWPESDI